MQQEKPGRELPAVPHKPETAPTEPRRQIETPMPDIVPERDPMPAKPPTEIPVRRE